MSTTKRSSAGSKAAASPRKKRKTDIDSAFDRQVLNNARHIAAGYRYILRPSESLGYVGRTLELPLVLADGPTPEDCLQATKFAVETAIATMLERGETPPMSTGRRSEQINIRLTAEEKLILEEESQRQGYKGLSDYVRAVALAGTGV